MSSIGTIRVAASCISNNTTTSLSCLRLISIHRSNPTIHLSRHDHRYLHHSSHTYAFSDTVKGLVYDMMPKSVFDPDESNLESKNSSSKNPGRAQPTIINSITGTRVILPPRMSNTIKSISDPSERIVTLIQKYPFISPKAVLLLVKPIQEMLSEKALTEVSVFLYKNFFCREACNLIVSTLPFGSAVSFFSIKFIPRILEFKEPEHLENTDSHCASSSHQLFDIYQKYHQKHPNPLIGQPLDQIHLLMTTLISSLISNGHNDLAKHVVQELYTTGLFDEIPHLTPENLLKDSTLVSKMLEASSTEDINIILQTRSLKRFYLKEASDSIRLSILKSLLAFGCFRTFSSLANSNKHFFTSPFVIRNIIFEMVHQFHLTEDSTIIEYLANFFVQFSKKAVTLHPLDIASFSYLAISAKPAQHLWGVANYHLQKISSLELPNLKIPSAQILFAYTEFLEKAVSLKLPFTCVEILKSSAKSITDPWLIASAMSVVLWGEKKTTIEMIPTHPDTSIVHNPHFNIQLLSTLFSSIPKESLAPALYFLLHRLNMNFNQKPMPGVILWKLLAALERSENLHELSRPVEKELAVLISSRPMIEQLHYYQLNCVSNEGIVLAVCERIYQLQHTIGIAEQTNMDADENMKLIFSALFVMKHKLSSNHNQKSSDVPNVMAYMYSLTSKSHEANQIPNPFTRENIQNLDPSHKASIEIANALAKSSQFQALLYYINCIGDSTPNEAFFPLLAEGTEHYPFICSEIKRWLEKTRGAEIPPEVLRKMAIGFSKCEILNDSQSTVRVGEIIHSLADRGLGIGKEAIQVYVRSLLTRAVNKGRGSRNRLKWAIALAKRQGVESNKVEIWIKELEYMRSRRLGYWNPKYRKH